MEMRVRQYICKYFFVILLLYVSTAESFGQVYNIKKDITEAFQNGDMQALSSAMSGLYELNYESPDAPGLYVIDTLGVLDILTHIDNVSETITYESDADKRIAADLLYSLYSSSIGKFNTAIVSSKRIVEFIENNSDFDRYPYYVTLDLLSGYYYEIQDFDSSIKCAQKILKHAKNSDDSLLLYQSSMQIARSELRLGNLKTAYKYIKVAYNHPDKEYLSARLSINSTYVEILQSLASDAVSNNKSKKFAKYYEELLAIFREYPDINVSTLLEDEFIIGTFSTLLSKGYKKEDINRYIDILATLRHESFVRFDSYDYDFNDGIAVIVRSWGEQALNAEKPEIACHFFNYAYDLSIKGVLSYDVSTNVNAWYAYFYQYVDNNHVLAFDAYRRSLDTVLKNNDKSTTEEYLKYILNILDESLTHVRYFYTEPKTENGIFLLSFTDTDYILNQWKQVTDQVISQYGEDFFIKVLKSHNDISENLRVFQFYSAEDNTLMQAHNLIKDNNHTTAIRLIEELIIDESLDDDKVIEIIWRIDNNLYLNTGYKESDIFLRNIREANFVQNRPEVISWIDREIERIKNWLGYKNAYAHSLVEEGKIDDAMKEYDNILLQIPYLENPDSLYVEVQMMRAVDLCYYAEKYEDALLVSKEVNSFAVDKLPNNHLVRSNSLSVIVQSLMKLENYSEALSYCEENINLLNRHKMDEDDHHLMMALQQYGDINLQLKNYDSAEQAYLTCLENHDEYNLVILVTNLAQIYGERLSNSIKLKDGKGCLEMYYKAINLFKSYPTADPELAFYFSPLSEQLIDILSIIPVDDRTKLCDDILALDLLVNGSKQAMGENSEIHPLEWHANVIQCISSRFREMESWREAILYHDKAIEFVIENDQHSWGSYLTNFYTDRAITKEQAGDWVAAIKDRILAFNSSQNNIAVITHEVEESFRELSTSINLALATKTSYAIAMYEDSLHPHLKYDECIKILELWRETLNRVLQNYGEGYLASLQNYIVNASQKWFYERYNGPMQYSVTDQLTLLSGIDYMKCNLDINENRLSDFNQTFRKLLDNVEPLDKTVEVRKLRYDIVKNISSTLSHAGYTDWAFGVLEGYWQDLISDANKDYELAEKVRTEIGLFAWNMGDISRLMIITNYVSTIVGEDHDSPSLLLFYDVNELITQLILLSRLQNYIDNNEAMNTLYYAKDLVDNNTILSNGSSVTGEIKSTLFNEIAIHSDDPNLSIEFYKKSIESSPNFDYGVTLNLASTYLSEGEYTQADSLLSTVYEYSQKNYMEPRWKSTLYKNLITNSIRCKDYHKALEYSQERLRIQESDYLQTSQSLTSSGRNNYWDNHYSTTLTDASTTDLSCGINGSNSYDAALFQKSILIRQKSAIKINILNSNDKELINTFEKYNQEIRSHSDSAAITEEYCMYLYSLHPEFVGSFSIPKWQDVQAQLGKKDLTVEFTLAYDEYAKESFYAAIILRKSFDTPKIVKLCRKTDLISMYSSKQDGAGFSTGLYQDPTSLYNLLWKPIEPYLKGVDNIYYSPYEFINNINIEAACKKPGSKPIGFQKNMIRVSTTGVLTSGQNIGFNNAVLFGDIDYDASFKDVTMTDIPSSHTNVDSYGHLRGSKHEYWKHLENAGPEVEAIHKLFNNNNISTTLYTNDNGTEEVFKSLSGNAPDLLHLATHGFYYTSEEAKEHEYFRTSDKQYYDSGVRSGMILTSGNHAWRGRSIPAGAEDGILTADEISGIDLTNTELITLSACQTALGDIASDGVYGIQRSFKIAGVDTIIMSLWQVSDEATYLMMEKFYTELTLCKDKREAFRKSQLFIKRWAENKVEELKDSFSDKIPEIQEQMISKYGGLLYPEYYWAAFVMLD